ncbi:MAG: DUF418 domain-containing protein [Gammaproteobacteria bacterium]|jgi:uncharacterized protein|nr:DUF418 domain-containing protein [Gammaproteobacteria bacterium]
MSAGQLQPTRQRLDHLDVLRGFALLGILLVNFQFFTRPLQAVVLGAEADLAGLDLMAHQLVRVFAEGKFYPLFSMLFGAGFALMFERARAREAPFWGVYLRRLFVLLLIGLAHMLLVWSGDILLVYSLSAFIMVLLFRNTPLKRLWKWAIVFWALPVLLMWLGALSIEATRVDPEAHAEVMASFQADRAEAKDAVARAAQVHAEGSYVENVAQRGRDLWFLFSVAPFWIPPFLGFFLLGRWLIATGRLREPEAHRAWLRRWRARGLLVGLPLAAAAAWLMHGQDMMMPSLQAALGMTLAAIASVFVPLGYLSAVTLGWRRLSFMAPAGRMALSNYLLQSLFWTWVFLGYGLGLWGQVPRAGQVLLALAFFALQVVLSHWWLGRFRFGPAEWLWRSLTYWRMQPMRRVVAAD